MLTPCQKTPWAGKTYQEAIELAKARGKDLDECNKRIEDLRRWSQQ